MCRIPVTKSFENVTVILPVINEKVSLTETIETILSDSGNHIYELLIVVSDRTEAESFDVIAQFTRRYGSHLKVHRQTLPFIGGAFREAFDLALGSHVIMMASDGETDPSDVRRLISEAIRKPNAIITASRWRDGGKFEGYDPVKLIANFAFQRLFSLLYRTHLTDLTFGYRLFPRELVRSIGWRELRHPFMLETLVKPLRLGIEVVEIPTVWRARAEGRSQNSFWRNFLYLRPGLHARFARPSSLLRS